MQKKRIKGFTLIELMIAMAVMAFGILGFTLLNARALNNRVFYREMSSSTFIAERAAEILTHLNYDNDLIADDNTDTAASEYPTASDSDGDTGTFAGMAYTVNPKTVNSKTEKWYNIALAHGKQHYYLRWEVTAGSNSEPTTPDDNIKLIRIFAAFEKKDLDTGNIVLGGYNPTKIGPTIITFNLNNSL